MATTTRKPSRRKSNGPLVVRSKALGKLPTSETLDASRRFYNLDGKDITEFVTAPQKPVNLLEIAGLTKGYKRKRS